ncbi:sulfite exporter TauE/SafE family protein [Tardisphaera miroshnichenkoae]
MYQVLVFLEMLVVSLIAGFVGALTGLGGGTVLVPIYTIMMGIPIIYAVGASLISTIATSSGSASAYVREGIANMRIGISLEIATTLGAIIGSLTVVTIYRLGLAYIIYIAFGVVLLFSLYPTYKRITPKPWAPKGKPDRTTKLFNLYGEYYDEVRKTEVRYYGVRWWLGLAVMFAAGFVSGLLGIGSGALKVLGMDAAMNLPIKVTTTTSNFMIGVTAATSSGVYWANGYIQPFIAAPTALGVLVGSLLGTKALVRMKGKNIRVLFLVILAALGAEMVVRGIQLMGWVL